jgi:hypothetical protein
LCGGAVPWRHSVAAPLILPPKLLTACRIRTSAMLCDPHSIANGTYRWLAQLRRNALGL